MEEQEEREEHHKVADQFEEEADRIQRPSNELKEEISNVDDDWEQKTKAEAVPGAMELPDPDDEPEPNRFEYEERTMEVPSEEGDDESEDDDSDSDSGDSGS